MFYTDICCHSYEPLLSCLFDLFLVIWLSCTGKVRHLPVVWSLPCWTLPFLCDAISRMEKVAEQGSAIATAVEGVDGEIDLQI